MQLTSILYKVQKFQKDIREQKKKNGQKWRGKRVGDYYCHVIETLFVSLEEENVDNSSEYYYTKDAFKQHEKHPNITQNKQR